MRQETGSSRRQRGAGARARSRALSTLRTPARDLRSTVSGGIADLEGGPQEPPLGGIIGFGDRRKPLEPEAIEGRAGGAIVTRFQQGPGEPPLERLRQVAANDAGLDRV